MLKHCGTETTDVDQDQNSSTSPSEWLLKIDTSQSANYRDQPPAGMART
jgi:hypothetical protein